MDFTTLKNGISAFAGLIKTFVKVMTDFIDSWKTEIKWIGRDGEEHSATM